jgi:hypothetical protein
MMGDEQGTGDDRGQAQAEPQALKEAARRTPLQTGAWLTPGSLEKPSQHGVPIEVEHQAEECRMPVLLRVHRQAGNRRSGGASLP